MVEEGFNEAKRLIKAADHMIYVTYPVLKESRLLIKILEQIGQAINLALGLILEKEFKDKKIEGLPEKKNFLEAFIKVSSKYGISMTQINELDSIFEVIERHKKSPMEFARKDKLIILSDNLRTEALTLERLKSFINTSKDFMKKIESSLFP